MRWVVVFENSPELLWGRADRGDAHLDYLRVHRHEILMAAGLHGPSDGALSGGFWVVETADRASAIGLIEGDPYYVPAQRRYRLQSWEQTFDIRYIAA